MFELDDLLMMDTATLTATLRDQITSGIRSPNEARRKLNEPPVSGGESPLVQQQNYSLAAIAKRDAGPDPFGTAKPAAAPAAPEPTKAAEPDQTAEALHLLFRKAPEELLHA